MTHTGLWYLWPALVLRRVLTFTLFFSLHILLFGMKHLCSTVMQLRLLIIHSKTSWRMIHHLEESLFYLEGIFAKSYQWSHVDQESKLLTLLLKGLYFWYKYRLPPLIFSLKRSVLWTQIQIYHLRQNMRLDQTPGSIAFANWLLEVGAGNGLGPDKTINLPITMCLPGNTIHSLINFIYPNIAAGHKPDEYFLHCTILSPKNNDVDDINHAILNAFPGDPIVLTSTDKALDNENLYPIEFLNTINAGGLSLAHLTLKPGCPVMLLWNLDPQNGLCNGTRMIIVNIRPCVLECRILGGSHAGKTVFIPHITIEPSVEDLPIPFSWLQFPIRLAFAITINKAQGQSVIYVGLDLCIPVFSHGQLYVALSQCTSAERIKVLFPP